MKTITIGVFGATGQTGKNVLSHALKRGFKVQALARNPSKVKIEDVNLTVIKGDFENQAALKETVKGADFVICCGGEAYGKNYDKGMMTRFVKRLWPILDAEVSLKAFLFQSVIFAPKPDGSNPFILKLLAGPAAYFSGSTDMLKDNTSVTKFMAANKKDSFEFVITRPGKLVDKEGGMSLKASEKPSFDAISFKDLGAFAVEAVMDKTLYGTYPFISPKK